MIERATTVLKTKTDIGWTGAAVLAPGTIPAGANTTPLADNDYLYGVQSRSGAGTPIHEVTVEYCSRTVRTGSVTVPRLRSQRAEHLSKVNSYVALREGWAGPRSTPPAADAINLAKLLIGTISDNFLPSAITASADGEIGLFWRSKDGNDFNAIIHPNRHLVWYGSKIGQSPSGDEQQIGRSISTSFFVMLKDIVG